MTFIQLKEYQCYYLNANVFIDKGVCFFLMLQPLRLNLFTFYYQDYNILNLFFDGPSPQSSLVFSLIWLRVFDTSIPISNSLTSIEESSYNTTPITWITINHYNNCNISLSFQWAWLRFKPRISGVECDCSTVELDCGWQQTCTFRYVAKRFEICPNIFVLFPLPRGRRFERQKSCSLMCLL